MHRNPTRLLASLLLSATLAACGSSAVANGDAGPLDGGAGSSGGGSAGGGSGGGSAGSSGGGSGGSSDGGFSDAGPVTGDCRTNGCPTSAAYCVNGWTLAQSTATGTCDTSTGDCSWQYQVNPCQSPYVGSCNGDALTWFQSPGTCVEAIPGEASCQYMQVTSQCAQGCSDGECAGLSCASDAHACGDICVTDDDVDHCGTVNCGACDAPANGTASCTDYTCGFACNAGFTLCGESCAACPTGTSARGGSCTSDGRCVAAQCSGAKTWAGNGRCYTWSAEASPSDAETAFDRFAVDSQGNLYTAYIGVDTAPIVLYFSELNRSAGTWQTQMVDSAATIGLYAVTVDAQGRPAIAYSTLPTISSNTATLHVAWWSGTGFTITDITTFSDPYGGSLGAAMAVESGGTLHLAWDVLAQSAYSLWHATIASGVVTSEMVSSGAAVSGLNVGLALDAQSAPWIATYQTTPQSPAITVANKSSGSWSLETVPVSGATQLTASELRLSSAGAPFVMAYDKNTGPILLSKNTGQWQTRAAAGTTVNFGWTLDAQDLLLGIGSDDDGLYMLSTVDGTADGALALTPISGTGDYDSEDTLRVAIDPLGGAFLFARDSDSALDLFHFQ